MWWLSEKRVEKRVVLFLMGCLCSSSKSVDISLASRRKWRVVN
jgi:hypothetical protein